jgi:hypothetical protein
MWKILTKQKEIVTEDDIRFLAEQTGWKLIVEEDKWLKGEDVNLDKINE